MGGDVDVHVPNTPATRVAVGVAVAVIGGSIIGTFAAAWAMNEKLTVVATQQQAISENMATVRADVNGIRERLRELEQRGGQ